MEAKGCVPFNPALAKWAAACAGLVFIVVAASAWLRIAAAPCPPAGCAGFTLADAVRLAHRVAAMGVSVIVLVVVALAWKPPASRGRRAASVASLVLVVVLAVVGRNSAGSAPPAVEFTNVFGGLALLACTVGLAVAASARPAAFARPAATLVLVLMAVLALLAGVAGDWPLARWLQNVVASVALCGAVAAAVASRAARGPDPPLSESVATRP